MLHYVLALLVVLQIVVRVVYIVIVVMGCMRYMLCVYIYEHRGMSSIVESAVSQDIRRQSVVARVR